MSFNSHYVYVVGSTKQYVIQCKDYDDYARIKAIEDAKNWEDWKCFIWLIGIILVIRLVFGVIRRLFGVIRRL